jgi:hypothetical protein
MTSGTLPTFNIECRTFDIGISRYCNWNVRYRASVSDLRYRDTMLQLDIECLEFDIKCSKFDKHRYQRLKQSISIQYDIVEYSISKHVTSILTQFDIEETSISKFRTSITLYTNIEDFSIPTNATLISVYDIEAFLLRSNFVLLDIGAFCRIQLGLPTRYWTHIVVCTLHCKSIITRGSCAARALSRRSRGCTRRRGRTRCSGRSTGRSRRGGARPPGRRPQPPERAPMERRSV